MTDNLSNRQRDRLDALRRVQRRLQKQVATYRADGNPSRLVAELSAVTWAIEIIENLAEVDQLKEVE